MKLKRKHKPLIITIAIVIFTIIAIMSNLETACNFYVDKIVPLRIHISSWVKSESPDTRRFRLVTADIEKYERRLQDLQEKRDKLDKEVDELVEKIFKIEDKEIFYENRLGQLEQEKERLLGYPVKEEKPVKKMEEISYGWILPKTIEKQRIRIISLANNLYRVEFNLMGMKLLEEKNGKQITYSLADFLTMRGYFKIVGLYFHKNGNYYLPEGALIRNLTPIENYPEYFSALVENRIGDIFIGSIWSGFVEKEIEYNTGSIIIEDMINNSFFPGIIDIETLTSKYNVPMTGLLRKAVVYLTLPDISWFDFYQLIFEGLGKSSVLAFKSTGPKTFEFLSDSD